MAISQLLKFAQPSFRPCHISEFSGFVAAIDGSLWAAQAGYISPTEKFAIQFFKSKLRTLIDAGVIPLVVFDGNSPTIKDKEIQSRMKLSNKEEEIYGAYRRKLAREISTVLRQTGISYVIAPYEADVQIALLTKQGQAQVAVTEDSNFIVHDCELIIYKIRRDGNYQLYSKSTFMRQLKCVDKENAMQFVKWVSIVAGCDYFKWKDVGPATAWKLFDDGHIDDLVAFKTRVKKLLGANVPDYFEVFEAFDNADEAFKYQLCFDVYQKKLVPLNIYPPGHDAKDFPFAESTMPDKLAIAFTMFCLQFLNTFVP